MVSIHAALAKVLAEPFHEVFKKLRNRKESSMVRRRAFYRLCDLMGVQKITMGRYLGQDHSTVIYNLKNYDGYVATDREHAFALKGLVSKSSAHLKIDAVPVPQLPILRHANRGLCLLPRPSSFFIYPGFFTHDDLKTR